MPEPKQDWSGRDGARILRVWDPLVRLVHWSIAATILLNILSDGEWRLHESVGMLALLLVGLRILWGVVGPRPARFTTFPPSIGDARRHLRGLLRGRRCIHLSHNPLGAFMAYNMWATIGALGVTGLMMAGSASEMAEEAHELAVGWLLVSIPLHVGGVMLDGARTGVPLVRAMVTGWKRVPSCAWTP